MRRSGSFRGSALAALLAMLPALMLVPLAFAQNVREWSPAVSVDPGRLNGVNTSVNDGCPIEAPDIARKLAILVYRALKGDFVFRDVGVDGYEPSSALAS